MMTDFNAYKTGTFLIAIQHAGVRAKFKRPMVMVSLFDTFVCGTVPKQEDAKNSPWGGRQHSLPNQKFRGYCTLLL